ncbi:MAG: alternative oxidase [Rhodanobacter sp.]
MVNTILAPDRKALAEERDAEPQVHHAPAGFSDRFALGFTKLLRFTADTFFAKRYGHRAIVLETVAAVPGMVGAMFTHLTATSITALRARWAANRSIPRSPRPIRRMPTTSG